MANNFSIRIIYKSSTGRVVTLSKAKIAHVYVGRKKLFAFEFSKATIASSTKTRNLNKEINRVLSGLLSKSSKKPKPKGKLGKKAKASPTKKKTKPKKSSPKKRVIIQEKPAKRPVPKKQKPILIRKSGKVISDLQGLIKRERLDKKNSWKEEPRFHGIYGDIRFTPFIPETDFYKKILIEKKVNPVGSKDLYELEIMDYKLKKEFEINETNTEAAIRFIRYHFYPHIEFFIKRFSGSSFIFRLSFIRFDSDGNEQPHGFSGSRFQARHMKDFELLSADAMLNPKKFLYSEKTKNSYVRASLGNRILLTGFTLEAIRKVHVDYFEEKRKRGTLRTNNRRAK